MHALNTAVSAARSRSKRNRTRAVLPALLAGALSTVGLVPLAAPAAAAGVPHAVAGPVDNAHGYPMWFEDGDGLRLELCLNQQDQLCPLVDALPDPDQPASVPENFTEEAFWWSGEAAIDAPSGASALLVMAQEAAFGGSGEVAFGQQAAFQRLRIRIDDAVPLARYTVTTPYGVQVVEADDRGRVRFTNDQGCLAQPCGDYAAATTGPIGPFLRWDPAVAPAAPAGYVGDPNVEHRVVGSPTGQNLFRVAGPGLTAAGALDGSIETNLFTVQGRLAKPRATISHQGDLYEPSTVVTITSSFPGESEVAYTFDPSADPVTSGTRVEAAEGSGAVPVTLPATDGPVTLRYAVITDDATSEVYEQQYDLRAGLATVTASPAPAIAPAVLEGKQDVELASSTPGRIFYTTDGTRPRLDASNAPMGSTRQYAGEITVTRTTTVKAIALPDPVPATDEVSAPPAPQPGPVKAFHYVIHNLRAVSDVEAEDFGYPFSMTDVGLPATDPTQPRENAVELELCLDDPLCPVVGDLPDPSLGLSFPDNFPDESFWWSGEAEFDTANGGRARLILAAEAAFGGSGAVAEDQQVAFGRIRVRMDDMVPLATYEIVHPYGVVRATADDRGRVAYTDDNGCMNAVCGFERMLTQPVGPFLRWDPAVAPAAPAGYIGDPNVTHRVVGSPYGTNEFRVRQVTDGQGRPVSQEIGQTDQFAVQGKLAGPGVTASHQTGAFNEQLDVTLEGNHLTDDILYTLDGSDPLTEGEVYDGPIHIGEGTTTLSYLAVGDGLPSLLEQEIYTVDSIAPTLAASPAGGEFTTAQNVSLTANESARIYYTVNGATPTQTSQQFAGPIRVANSLTLKAIAVDNAGNVSDVREWSFTVTPPTSGGGTGTGGDTGAGTGGGTGGTGGTGPTPDGTAPALVLQPGALGAVDAGGTTAFNGVLALNGLAVGGVPVTLQTRALATTGRTPVAPAWVDLATVTTALDGTYTFRGLKPTATADYRVVFAGDANHAATVSPVKRVEVRAVVKLSRPDKRVERRERITLRGQLAPVHPGHTVVVKLDGPGRHADKVKATVDRRGTWKVTIRAPRQTGSWRISAVWRGDVDHLGSKSTARTIHVVR